jgi:hypothetical protein
MANISINDLPADRTLDRQAMAHIRGGDGAPWVYGWMRAICHRSSVAWRR